MLYALLVSVLIQIMNNLSMNSRLDRSDYTDYYFGHCLDWYARGDYCANYATYYTKCITSGLFYWFTDACYTV